MGRKVLLVLGAAVTMALGISAGTLALFSAATPQADNQFDAGTVKVISYRDMGDTIPGPMFYTDNTTDGKTYDGTKDGRRQTGFWAPGDKNTRAIFIENKGSLAILVKSIGATAQAGSSSYLADKLQVKVTTDSAGNIVIASGTMTDFVNSDQALAVPISMLPSPVPRALYFHVTLPLSADNSYQDLRLVVDFHVNVEQKKNNP